MSEKTSKRGTKPAADGDIGDSSENEGRGLPRRLIFVLVGIVAVIFVVYSVISLIGLQSQINERRGQLEEIKSEIKVQEIKNDEMSKTYNLSDDERSEYIERIARDDLDYVKEGERVFVNVSGD